MSVGVSFAGLTLQEHEQSNQIKVTANRLLATFLIRQQSPKEKEAHKAPLSISGIHLNWWGA